MNFNRLIKKFPELSLVKGETFYEIDYIESDSRKTKTNDIYCLYDIHLNSAIEYLNKSLENNCTYLYLSAKSYDHLKDILDSKQNITTIMISKTDPAEMHGYLASYLLGDPSKKLDIIAVTGTNGKTTTTAVLFEIFSKLGLKSGLIGTLHIKYNNTIYESGYTTPDPSTLQFHLSKMASSGVKHVFLEASSHGLKLGRLNGCQFKGALFTNLTPDHLDFHKDMDDYLRSKFILFNLLQNSKIKNKVAVISIDSPGSEKMYDLIKNSNPNYVCTTFGKNGDFKSEDPELNINKTIYNVQQGENRTKIETKLLGNFNYINTGLAFTITNILLPTRKEEIVKVIGEIQPIQGRFELIYSENNEKLGIVDYAHTPDALENILNSIKEIPHSEIITIFGCGGDRDKKKRPLMGQIACKLSDRVILTSDNPRLEDPLSIIKEIEIGIVNNYTNYSIEIDRKKAIQMGVKLLPKNGFLLVAGKGHENYQILGTTKTPYSDLEELKKAFHV
jgi:UDP-N-acetylmuramoyl-L-alanyl-D-glutamate--2,6-diaminopimelate ligase